MPNLNHVWQRFLLASSLLIGLAIGVIATVFGYSNLTTVDVHWSVFHVNGVPLWTVAVVPIALVLVAGSVYHWLDSFHHFTEHMRHRHRVHELEAEVASLRAHLDQVLEMPDHSSLQVKSAESRASLPQPEDQAMEAAPVADAPAQPSSESAPRRDKTRRVKLAVAPEPAAAQANGNAAPAPPEPAESSEPAAPAAEA